MGKTSRWVIAALMPVLFSITLYGQSVATSQFNPKDSSYTIAVILPFNAGKVYVKDMQQNDFSFPEESRIAVEFYNGVMLALDSLKATGLHATVFVYDAPNDTPTINALLKKPELEAADLIIGPLSGYGLEKVQQFALAHHIPMVSPLLASFPFSTPNQFFILANATIKTHCRQIYDYLLQNELTSRLIMLYRKTPDDLELVGDIKNWAAKKTEAGYPSLHFIELTDSSRTTYLRMKDSLFLTQKNVLLVASNDETFVRGILRQAKGLAADYPIRVFGMPTWINFNQIPAALFDSAKTMITTSFFVDKDSWGADQFKNKYLAKYGVNPTAFAARGYDEGYYFISHFMQMGRRLYLTAFPPAGGLTQSTSFRVYPVMPHENEVYYRENNALFFLLHQDGKWNRVQ